MTYESKNLDIKRFPNVKENIDLSKFTTFKIGGKAKYFIEVKNKNQLIEIIKTARELEIPFFIFGGGSNLLISDKDFNGLIIRVFGNDKLPQIERLNDYDAINVFSGTILSNLIMFAINHNLEGLEWAAGIPGTIGGAIVGNAGAFGYELKDSILEVTVLMMNGNLKEFTNSDCKFTYRESIFKNNSSLIIIEARLRLKQGQGKEKLLEIVKEKMIYRGQKYSKLPNAGSIFKNITNEDDIRKILEIMPEITSSVKEKWGGKIPAGFLIENCGLKNKRIGNVAISQEHANCFINLGNAKATDVISLIDFAKEKVFERFGVKLEEEIVKFNF